MDRDVSKINKNEQVARILFSPSHIYEGRVSPKAFLMAKDIFETANDLSPEIDYFQKELAMLCDGVHKF